MSRISVPNVKEIHSGEGWLKLIVVNWCEEEKNVKKIGQFSEHISCKLLIRFSSNLVCKVMYNYSGHTICKFGRKRSSSYRDT